MYVLCSIALVVFLAVAPLTYVGGAPGIVTDDGEPIGQKKVEMIVDDPCPF